MDNTDDLILDQEYYNKQFNDNFETYIETILNDINSYLLSNIIIYDTTSGGGGDDMHSTTNDDLNNQQQQIASLSLKKRLSSSNYNDLKENICLIRKLFEFYKSNYSLDQIKLKLNNNLINNSSTQSTPTLKETYYKHILLKQLNQLNQYLKIFSILINNSSFHKQLKQTDTQTLTSNYIFTQYESFINNDIVKQVQKTFKQKLYLRINNIQIDDHEDSFYLLYVFKIDKLTQNIVKKTFEFDVKKICGYGINVDFDIKRQEINENTVILFVVSRLVTKSSKHCSNCFIKSPIKSVCFKLSQDFVDSINNELIFQSNFTKTFQKIEYFNLSHEDSGNNESSRSFIDFDVLLTDECILEKLENSIKYIDTDKLFNWWNVYSDVDDSNFNSQNRNSIEICLYELNTIKIAQHIYFLQIRIEDGALSGYSSDRLCTKGCNLHRTLFFNNETSQLNDCFTLKNLSLNELIHNKNANYIVFELFEYENQSRKLLSSKRIAINRDLFEINKIIMNIGEFYERNTLLTASNSGSSIHFNIKFKSNAYPNKQLCRSLYRVENDDANLDVLVDSICDYRVNNELDMSEDFLIIRKLLFLLAQINDNRKQRSSSIKNIFRLLVSILSSYSKSDCLTFSYLVEDYKDHVNLRNSLIQSLLANIKEQTDFDSQNLNTFHSFYCLIDILTNLIKCDANNNDVKLKFKYEMNDVMLKLSKKPVADKYILYKIVDFRFINLLNINNLYSDYELTELICLKLFKDIQTLINSNDGLVDDFEDLLSKQLFQLSLFKKSYEFRDRISQLALKLIENREINEIQIDIIMFIIENRSKINKRYMDELIRYTLRILMNRLDKYFKEDFDFDSHLNAKYLICFMDILDIIVSNNTQQYNNYIEQLDLFCVFDMFTHYLLKIKLEFMHNWDKLWFNLNYFLLKFIIHIKKSVLRYLMMNGNEPNLLISYLELCFAYLNANNMKKICIYLKHKMFKNLINLFTTLNTQLKRSIYEYMIINACNVLLNIESIHKINDKITDNDDRLDDLYDLCIEFLITLQSIDPNFDSLMIISLTYTLINNKNFNFNQLKRYLLANNHTKIDLNLVYSIIIKCYDYKSLLKTSIIASTIEKLLIVYDLYKLISNIRLATTTDNANYGQLIRFKHEIELHLLDNLYKLNKSESNYVEMSFIRKTQADLIDSSELVKLKEVLYFKSLKKFNLNVLHKEVKAQNQQNKTNIMNNNGDLELNNETNQLFTSTQIDICKQLNDYDDVNVQTIQTKLIDLDSKYDKLKQITSGMDNSKKINLQMNAKKNAHRYFRIGFFGGGFIFETMRNKYFVYRHKTNEMLSIIQSLIVNRLEYANEGSSEISKVVHLLHHNQLPKENIKDNTTDCFIQICTLNTTDKGSLFKLVDDYIDNSLELQSQLTKYDDNYKFFYYDRPYYLDSSSNQHQTESVQNLWIERNLLLIDDHEPQPNYYCQFSEVKGVIKINLNPIYNAINDIGERTKELKDYVIRFALNNSCKQINANNYIELIHNLQPLTMRLLGCLDAKVNGGLIVYIKQLLNEKFVQILNKSNNKKYNFMNKLHSCIKEQLNVLESGLSLHNRLIKDLVHYIQANGGNINNNNNNAANSVVNGNNNHVNNTNNENNIDSNNDDYHKKYGNIENMKQLNNHLILCLKSIEKELSEHWSKLNL